MKNNLSFGGKKLILIGDLMQLPPIIKNQNDDYFFESKEFDIKNFKVVYLDKVYRQDNLSFIEYLHKLRLGEFDQEFYKKNILASSLDGVEYTKMFYSNNRVNIENINHLSKIDGKQYSIPSINNIGKEWAFKALVKNTVTPIKLEVKVGAKILFTKNHPSGIYCNGNTGIVKNILTNNNGEVEVIELENLSNKSIVQVVRVKFSNNDEKDEASFCQFPITLGFAITIHKSQGMSLDSAIVDFGDIYYECPHLVYTAFSRVRTPQKLCVRNFKPSMVTVHYKAFQFDRLLYEHSVPKEMLYEK